MNKGSWSQSSIAFVTDNYEKLTIEQMAAHLGKTPLAVQLYMHRHRLCPQQTVKRNILLEILRMKFNKPEYFQPTREFYKEIGISQRRWWDLYYGRKQITDDEYLAVVKFLGVTLEEAFECRQLKLFSEDE